MENRSNINSAISAAMGEIQKLGKDDKNPHGNYSFASIDAFLDMCRPICAAHGLHPLVNTVASETFEAGNNKLWAKFTYQISLAHTSGENIEPVGMDVMLPLTGAQTSGSAQSYAVKQFLRGLFLISTGDKDDVDLKPQAEEDGVDSSATQAGAGSKSFEYDIETIKAKISSFTKLSALNIYIEENNGTWHKIEKQKTDDWGIIYAHWKQREKELQNGQ